jgi:hypothetical protein
LLANTLFASTIPFAFVEAQGLAEFLYFVAPQFTLPTAKLIGSTLLDKQYNKIKNKVETALKAKKGVTLFVDGSADNCQDPITHILVASANETPFLLKEVPHLQEPHTSVEILCITNECVAELKAINVETRGLITDNEKKMQKVRKEFYNQHNSQIPELKTP